MKPKYTPAYANASPEAVIMQRAVARLPTFLW